MGDVSISVENRQFFPPRVFIDPAPLKGLPFELAIGARGQKTRMMGLPDSRESFKIGLDVLMQYKRVTSSHPASHVFRSKDRTGNKKLSLC